jgi:hypothetical protein
MGNKVSTESMNGQFPGENKTSPSLAMLLLRPGSLF